MIRWKPLSLWIASVFSLSLHLACTRKLVGDLEEDDDDEVPEVAVIQIQKEELFDYMNFSGVLAARSQETLYAPLSGQVREITVQDGTKVSKGKKLLSIKPDSEGNEFRDHMLRASRSGTVINLLAKAGLHVDKNQELLSIADLGAFKTEIAVTLEDLRFLKVGQKVEMTLSSSEKIEGVIQSLAGTPDIKTKTFNVIVKIPCSKLQTCKDVYPGLLANLSVKKNPHLGYRLPFKYLRRQKSHILVVDKENIVRFVEVEVGQHYGQDVEILKGISSETRIVTSFSTMPQEGQKVKIIPPGSPAKVNEDSRES